MRRTIAVCTLAFLLGTTGCLAPRRPDETLPDPEPPAFEHPSFVAILTEGVTIWAEDGSFALESDEPREAPFETAHVELEHEPGPARTRHVNDVEAMRAAIREAKEREREQAGGIPADVLLDAHEEFVEAGARRVRVAYPGRETPLYGVLALGPVAVTSDESSARRSYRVAIPPERVEQALGAQVAVVFQPYGYTRTVERTEAVRDPGGVFTYDNYHAREVHVEEEAADVSWVLWLSDAPFAGHDPDWIPPRRGPTKERTR